jgi:CDP-6-deoxy-D-xylo-4-hexulose-3-dehydrase
MFENLQPGKDYKIIGQLKNTDRIMKDSFWVGVYPGMSSDTMKFIASMIKEFVSNYA